MSRGVWTVTVPSYRSIQSVDDQRLKSQKYRMVYKYDFSPQDRCFQ